MEGENINKHLNGGERHSQQEIKPEVILNMKEVFKSVDAFITDNAQPICRSYTMLKSASHSGDLNKSTRIHGCVETVLQGLEYVLLIGFRLKIYQNFPAYECYLLPRSFIFTNYIPH